MPTILDNLLQPFRRGRRSTTSTIGDQGTAIYGGYIVESEKNRKLTGREKYRTYSNVLANVPIVAAGTRYFLNLVAKAKWETRPADESELAKFYAEQIGLMIHDLETPWHRVIRRAAMHRFYGFSIQEWTAKRNRETGIISFRDIAPRPQITIERWDVNVDGTVIGVTQRSPQTQEELYLPRWKIIYMIDDSINDSPEGLGLFRHIIEPANRLLRYQELEAYGFETDLRGIPVARVPYSDLQERISRGELSNDDKTKFEQPIIDFIKNRYKDPQNQLGLILDSNTYETQDEIARPSNVYRWDMSLLNAQHSSQEEVSAAIIRLNQEIARVLGVEGLLLGSTQHGSQALSRDKSHNFDLIVNSVHKELRETFEKDFIAPIFDLNGWDKNLMPTFKIEAIQYRDIEQVTIALRNIAQAGSPLAMGDPAIDEVRELLGLSPSANEAGDGATLEMALNRVFNQVQRDNNG